MEVLIEAEIQERGRQGREGGASARDAAVTSVLKGATYGWNRGFWKTEYVYFG